MEARRAILKALSQFPVDVSEEVVQELEKRVRSRFRPEKNKLVANFAYIVAKNWALDAVRRKATATRRTTAKLLHADEEKVAGQRKDRCRAEFEAIVRMISSKLHHTQQTQIAMVRMTCFEQKTHEECGLVIRSTRDQQIQWKSRGIRLITPHASEDLIAFLRDHRKNSARTTQG